MIVKEVVRAGKGDVRACMWLDVDLSFSSHKSVEDEMLPIPPAWTFIFANQKFERLAGPAATKADVAFQQNTVRIDFQMLQECVQVPDEKHDSNPYIYFSMPSYCPSEKEWRQHYGDQSQQKSQRECKVA